MDRQHIEANFPSDINAFFDDAKYVKENIDLVHAHITSQLVDKEVDSIVYKSCEETSLIMAQRAERVYRWAMGSKEIGLPSLSVSEAKAVEEAVLLLDTGYVFMVNAFTYAVDRTNTFSQLPTDRLYNTFDRVKGRIDEMVKAIYT